MTKPFLKWAGGKSQLIPTLQKYIPDNFRTYLEPFVGAGALFFYLEPKRAILNDINDELINTYTVVKNDAEKLIGELRHYKNDENLYYSTRKLNPKNLTKIERAARIIFLNKTCFNGLYRENKNGQFNVPFGKKKKVTICDSAQIINASKSLRNVKFISGDYQAVIKNYAHRKDFIFLDPPYYPAGGYSDFKRYTKESFYEKDHTQLKKIFDLLVKRGCYVILTNSDTNFVRKLYNKYSLFSVPTRRNISSKAKTRTSSDLVVLGNIVL